MGSPERPAEHYSNPPVSKTAIVNGKSEHATDPQDIIPPFEYSETNDGPVLTYPGKNWDERGQAIYNNGCAVPKKNAEIISPVFEQATCMNKSGSLLPAVQGEGVTTAQAPTLNDGVWSVVYAPAEGYSFPEGMQSTFAFEVVAPGPSDPNWDAEAGECRIANTGIASINTSTLVIAGGLIFAGMIFLGLTNFIGRRRNA